MSLNPCARNLLPKQLFAMRVFLRKCRYKIVQLYKGLILKDPSALLALRWIREDRQRDFRHRYELPVNALIFDCGGFEGNWSKRMLDLYPTSTIYIFEVVPSYIDVLKKRFSGINRVRVFDFGLGSEDKVIDISLAGVGSSFFVNSSQDRKVQGRIVELSRFLNEQGVKEIDLLKMNIEGGEYELLDSLFEHDFVKRCKDIQVQFHNYGLWSVNKREELRLRLLDSHYLTYDFAWTFENWRRRDNQIITK